MRLQHSRFDVLCMLSLLMMQFSELLAYNNCDSEVVYAFIDDCVDQTVPYIFSPPWYKLTASLSQARISAECGARHNLKTCVETKLDYCPNKANILKILDKRHRVCEGDLPRPWITQWVRSNPSAKLSINCSYALASVEHTRDKERFWPLIHDSFLSLNEYTAEWERYLSEVYICLSDLYSDMAPVINMEPECVELGNWNTVMTLMALTPRTQVRDFFAVLPDDVLEEIKKNAASQTLR